MGAPEDEHIFGVQLRESANDGSDFTNADADYRKLFLGEDGQLHVKDSAGAVTDIGGTVADILDLPTAEMDDTLVLAPDGAGGVEFRAEGGGPGGATAVQPSIFKTYSKDAQNTASWSKTITAVPVGRCLLVIVGAYNRVVNTPTLTNVTFTQVAAHTFAGSNTSIAVYLGIPSSTSGTTLGITATGSNWIIADVAELFDVLDGTAIDTVTFDNTDASSQAGVLFGPMDCDPGSMYVIAACENDATSGLGAWTITAGNTLKFQLTPGANDGMASTWGRTCGTHVAASFAGGSGGADIAGVLVAFT